MYRQTYADRLTSSVALTSAPALTSISTIVTCPLRAP